MKAIDELMKRVRRISPRCCDAARLLSQAADVQPPLLDRSAVAMHVLLCRSCRRYRQSVRFLSLAMKESPFAVQIESQTLPIDARERLSVSLTANRHLGDAGSS